MTSLSIPSISWIIACMVAAGVHIYAVRRSRTLLAAAAKISASTAFVLFAAVSGGEETTYGRLIVAALVLSWIGDVLLISPQKSIFLAGIGAFLLAHICFAAAFTLGFINVAWLLGSFIFTACAGIALFRWLQPRLNGIFMFAVPVYIGVIMVMVSLAVATSAAGTTWVVAAGAIIFAVSDVFVARDRFVGHSFVNKLWGIPLYYIAQLLLAASVAAVQR